MHVKPCPNTFYGMAKQPAAAKPGATKNKLLPAKKKKKATGG